MMKQVVVVSELLLVEDLDSMILRELYVDHKIVFDFERMIMTTSGPHIIEAGEYLHSYLEDGQYCTRLYARHKVYDIDVDAGLMVYCDWCDMPTNCHPTLTINKELTEQHEYYTMNMLLEQVRLEGLERLVEECPEYADNWYVLNDINGCKKHISRYDNFLVGRDQPED